MDASSEASPFECEWFVSDMQTSRKKPLSLRQISIRQQVRKALRDRWKTTKFSSHLDSKEGKKLKTLYSFWIHKIFPTSDRILNNEAECDIPVLHKSRGYFTGRREETERGQRLEWDIWKQQIANSDCQISVLLIHMQPWGILENTMRTREGGPSGHELKMKANCLPGLMISSSSLNVTLEFFRFLFGLWISKFPSSMVSVEILLLWAVLNSVRF